MVKTESDIKKQVSDVMPEVRNLARAMGWSVVAGIGLGTSITHGIDTDFSAANIVLAFASFALLGWSSRSAISAFQMVAAKIAALNLLSKSD